MKVSQRLNAFCYEAISLATLALLTLSTFLGLAVLALAVVDLYIEAKKIKCERIISRGFCDENK